MRRHPLAALVVISLAVMILVAACQGSGGATSVPTLPQLSARPTAGATLAPFSPGASGLVFPTPPASGSSGAPSSPGGSVTAFHGAPELEASVPTSAAGKPLSVESVTAATFTDAQGAHKLGVRCRWYDGRGLRCRDQNELEAALAALGRTMTDVAVATGYNVTKSQEIEVQVTQVAGASGDQLKGAILASLSDATAKRKRTLNVSSATVGGKPVSVITYKSSYPLGKQRWFYATGNLLFDVRRATGDEASQILTALP